ncbi:MAG: hypothetical protein OEM18_04650 [Nitrosopumilus sp.]|jgi:hypothetical protein|nr:hypothetical protein [Nitrosopumilus sp.]MDH3501878.1 hypothetical protein [Nitrosopumilus sp.]
MNRFDLPEHLSEKIYEIKTDETKTFSKLVSYFPLSDDEKKEIQHLLGDKFTIDMFSSIFSDIISDEEWEKSKVQIKKRFHNELFNIDKI